MFKWLIIAALAASIYGQEAAMAGGEAAEGQHKVIGVSESKDSGERFRRTEHPDALWFPKAGLGLFVHWGISSVHGGIDLSWGMMAEVPWDSNPEHTVTPNAYFGLADRFSPDRYDPDKWLKAARSAGFRYAVLTARHHDGYALWPSRYGEFGTRTHMGGRDLLRPYVHACRKNGLKVGFYYSPPDWYYNRNYMSFRYGSGPERPAYGLHHQTVEVASQPEGWEVEYKAYIKGQVEELLTRYGKIDILWFDGGPEAISMERIRQLQPGIVVNDRMHGYGDFRTPEWEMPEKKFDGWWENCASWIEGWGYRKTEHYNSSAWMLSRLARVRAWGGNLLLNVGPRPDGELPEAYYQRTKEVAEWMKHSAKSIHDTSPGSWPEKCNVPVTVRGKSCFLHALPEFRETIVIREDKRPARAVLLNTGREIPFQMQNGEVRIDIPSYQRTDLVDVVEVRWR